MSLFEDNRYRWRETYFVQFPLENRPSADKMRQAISTVGDQIEVTEIRADDEGNFESMTLLAPDNFAAIDVSFLSGEEVIEHGIEFSQEIESLGCSGSDTGRAERLREYDGRFDILHFEEVGDSDDDEEPNAVLDPGALLLVLETLAELTSGITVDPQTGTLM